MIYIIGQGSHSDVVMDILPEAETIHYTEDLEINWNYQSPDNQFICAVGDNYTRKQIVSKYHYLNWTNAIHPRAIISNNVGMGKGNVICAGAVIQSGTVIGNHCIINTNASVDHHCRLHNYIHLAPNTAVCGKVQIHSGTFLGVSSSIVPKVTVKPWSFIKANTLIKSCSSTIPIAKPFYFQHSIQDALESQWISFQGKYVKLAEERLEKLLGVKHALLLANGTCATHCLFIALKRFHPEIRKIYVPDNVYVAAYNSALYEYPLECLEVLPLDNTLTLNMRVDEDFIQNELAKNSAVLVVHNTGNIINVPRLKRLRPDLVFIEDNCEGFLGKYENQYSGTAGLCSSLSFFANKTITSGEGGAFCTNNTEIYNYIKHITHQGQTSQRYLHDELAYNYRITNLQAALLYDQLDSNYIEKIINEKKKLAAVYSEKFSSELLNISAPNCENSNWMFAVGFINSKYNFEYYNHHGIETRPFFYHCKEHKHLKNIKLHRCHSITTSYFLQDYCFMIPSFSSISVQEIDHIVDAALKDWGCREKCP